MNNYISAKEFLNQSEKVQKIFIEWWKLKDEDLITNEYNDITLVCNALMDTGYIDKPTIFKREIVFKNIKSKCKSYIPLLQMHQLVKFIEDKVGEFDIKHTEDGILLYSDYRIFSDLDNLQQDLLQTLWQVAVRIAE